MTILVMATGLCLVGMTGLASATRLNSRNQLDSLLGSNRIYEDFESFSVSFEGQLVSTVPLNSTSTFAGQGPGLVQDGATYQSGGGSGRLWLNGDGYYGLKSKTLGDSSEWGGNGIQILYTSSVNAIGFDMQNYVGYGMAGMVSVYDTVDGLISTTSVNGGFFGWENIAGGGIGSVFIAANDRNYIMIDNHGYGIVPEPATVVAVDIKPGSCPNPVNVKSKGVLPVVILGTDDYDVTTIDPTSIRLTGVEPLRSSYEDVATSVSDSNDCNCTEEGPDGFLDLTLKFKTQRIVEAVGDVNDGDVLTLELTGVLFDPMPFETPIEGADCILIRGRHKPINPADINKDGVVDGVDFAIFTQNWLQSSIVQD